VKRRKVFIPVAIAQTVLRGGNDAEAVAVGAVRLRVLDVVEIGLRLSRVVEALAYLSIIRRRNSYASDTLPEDDPARCAAGLSDANEAPFSKPPEHATTANTEPAVITAAAPAHFIRASYVPVNVSSWRFLQPVLVETPSKTSPPGIAP